MRIAIVGSGISGLVAAHLLHRDHELHVFEASSWIGGHTHTVDIALGDERLAVDTGFIVYNEKTYPNFVHLLDALGVATQASTMSFSVRCEASGLEWAGGHLGNVFAQRRNLLRPSFHRMLRDILRFYREARELLDSDDDKVTLADWAAGRGYSREFMEHYVIPMGAAIWSAAPTDFRSFPARSFVRFFANHGLLERPSGICWRSIAGGSRRYVEPLVAPFRDRIRLRCPVVGVRREAGGVLVRSAAGRERFDRAILACHSDQALSLLENPSVAERRILSAIRYQANDVVLHTDASLLPRSRRAWASWNYRVPRQPTEAPIVSYHMNRLQGLRSRHELIVSLNATDLIAQEKVLGRYTYHHPVFTAEAVAAQKLHSLIDGVRRIHFCGAYWGYGFHEDGVRSGLAVARALGRSL